VKQYEALWQLRDLQGCENLSHNYVLAGYQGKQPVILKISPDKGSLNHEVAALRAFADHGAVAVLEHADDALLLQRAVPGKLLKDSFSKGSQVAIEIACNVMKKLHAAPQTCQSSFPRIEDWLAALDQEWNIPQNHLQTARRLKNDLLKQLQGRTKPVLLHGDLHRENILSNGAKWLIIDPKGVVGYPINEAWAMVEEPEHDLKYISDCFGFHFDEVVRWYYIHLVLAACWRVEDHLDPTLFLDLAHTALSMTR
jgi:streptomycin 6-kinase